MTDGDCFGMLNLSMPELPEVETVRAQLQGVLIGKTIKTVQVRHQKTVGRDRFISKRLAGQTITNIDRFGKLLIFSFRNQDDLFLLIHLKMTGQLLYRASGGRLAGGGHRIADKDLILPNPHTRVIFHFTDDSALYFNDMRLFGYVKRADLALVTKVKSTLGPELIDPKFDVGWFIETLRRRRVVVKAALLDQSFVAGLGNIYVDEALWQARVRPTKRSNRLTKAEGKAIYKAASSVMKQSIKMGGTTFRNFVDVTGKQGNFSHYLEVFGRPGQVCSRCGGLIKKIRSAGRGTHYCPQCQT